MEQEESFNFQDKTEKIYKDKEILVGTLLGGALVAGYMAAENYKSFGEPTKARRTWIITIFVTALLFFISFAPYIDRAPGRLLGLVCAGIIFLLVRIYQGEKIDNHIRAEKKIHSWGKTIGVAVAGLVITLVVYLSAASLVTTIENKNFAIKTYGTLHHKISYNTGNLSEGEIDKISESLVKANFFDNEKQKFVYVKKVENNYEISISVLNSILERPENLKLFDQLHDEIQPLFPDSKIVINLVVDKLDNVIKRIE